MAGCVCDLHFSNARRGMQGTQTITTNTLLRLAYAEWNETYITLIAIAEIGALGLIPIAASQ